MNAEGFAWPAGNRAAVLVTVNMDGERTILGSHPELEGSQKTLSTTHYGLRRGVDAVLNVLEEERVRATWFTPGMLVSAETELLRRIDQRHEIAMRGHDIRPVPMEDGPRRAFVEDALRAFSDLGITPRGFRLPAGEWPMGLAGDLLDAGIDWSSSFVGDELPFELPGAGGRSLLEMPYSYATEDRQAFEWNFAPAMPAGHSRIASYDDVLENWAWEFDGVRSEGSVFVLTLSPHIIGTPGRISLLAELIQHMRSADDVWFATGSELVDWWRHHGVERGERHPARVFLEESGWPAY